MSDTNTQTAAELLAIYQPLAEKLAPRTVELKEAGVAVDKAASPFARSAFAALLTGVSFAMVESIVVASYGSPKSPKTNKPLKGVSGLRSVEGGAAAYQTMKSVKRLADAMGDPTLYQGEGQAEGATVGGIIRPMVEAFTVNAKEAPKSLNALNTAVGDILAGHAKAVAAAAGVTESTEEGDNDNAPASVDEEAVALAARVTALSDEEFIASEPALVALSDLITARWSLISEAQNEEETQIAAVA